ncbi:MAG TPA: SpoIIE family protein phosphatase [Acidimicrobiales bacterium]|nr:SpoIIE family protein phosphatase [Acidimicrobiales bacterium]
MSASDRATSPLDGSLVVTHARAMAVRRAAELGRADLADDAAQVMSELVTNAVLHGGGCTGAEVVPADGGLRIEVRDASRVPPVLSQASETSLTGRGLRLVSSLAAEWGADAENGGKVVWAEVTGTPGRDAAGPPGEDVLAMWADDWDLGGTEPRIHVELGDVPTDLLLAAKSHVDNVVREFALASAGAEAGLTADLPPHMATLLRAIDNFEEARLAIKHQALEAARRGAPTTRLSLDLPASAADAAEEYARALDEIDAYCRASRMLTLETPPQHRAFRSWYIEELVTQLRAAASGNRAPAPQPFERRLLAELDRLARAQRASERAARLYSVAAALASAATPEAVADAVLNEGVAALRAVSGGVLLITEADRLPLPGAVGYDETVLARLREESLDAELPAAVALRTGEPVWLESRLERDTRFPELVGMQAGTMALCAVPLEVQGRRLGALRFSFAEARLFDEDERRFVMALAAQTAHALNRAQLQRERLDVSRRLQRSLLPPKLPSLPGLDVAAIYHPFGDGMDVGGDFYDIWLARNGRWAIAIGDVAGTGPEAAAVTALVRHTLRALTMTQSDPERVMRNLNQALLDAADVEDDRFCTAIFGLLAADEAVVLHLASGGHPPVLVRRASGHVEQVHVGGGLLGVFVEPDVSTTRITLEPGDVLMLLTDGVIEARHNGQLFTIEGVERVLADEVRSARAAATALEQAVLDHAGGVLTDDMAAVVVRVPDDGA